MEQTTTDRQLRILLADDHPLFRHGLSVLLSTCADFVVVGEATTGEEAIELAGKLQPDVLLMDIQMPGINGIEATRRIVQIAQKTRILMVTMFEDDASVFMAMKAGARGYILKDAQKDDILRAIRAVGSGEAIFSPIIAARMIEFFSAPPRPVAAQIFPELTEREREILGLIAQGENNAEIARRLVLGQNTVRNYVSSIFSKLQVADRTHAILRAREAGWG